MEVSVVEFVSRENYIKPSKPTPSHLTTFNLSLLDQLIPSPYAPIILFYQSNDVVVVSQKLESLKKSLSETLTQFYPLAGTIKDDQLSIECNDRGVRFVEAELSSSLRDFLARPDLNSSLQRLLPCGLGPDPSNDLVSNVQASVFLCGAIALGICISHKMLDGVALSSFIQSWSATSRGGAGEKPALYTASSLFPADDLWLRDSSMAAFGSLLTRGSNCVTKRFLFDCSAISSLKAEAASVENPTRVEVVSAFIWQCVAESRENIETSLATHVVNLRRRTKPALPEGSVGNLVWIVPALSAANHDAAKLGGLVGLLRDSFSRVDDDFVKALSGDKGRDLMANSLNELCRFGGDDSLAHVGFSSLCNLGFYDADFGWGKPVWVSSVGLSSGGVFMNLAMLVDTRLGDVVEA